MCRSQSATCKPETSVYRKHHSVPHATTTKPCNLQEKIASYSYFLRSIFLGNRSNPPFKRVFPKIPDVALAGRGRVWYNGLMSDIGWNSVEIHEDERPQVSAEDLREMLADIDPEDFDEPVQEFLNELERGGDPEDLRRAATLLLQDEIDFSPELAAAGVEPDEQLIALLLAVGANVNASNAYGQPPLHLAAQYGYVGIVEMLLAAGADLRLHNTRGETASQLAATPELAARLTPPMPDMLPPEVEDADVGEHVCTCHGHGRHHCECGEKDPHHQCTCGGHGRHGCCGHESE